MNRIRVQPAELLAPAVGVTYLVLWWVAEAGRLQNGVHGPIVTLLPFLLFSVVIAISKQWPTVALAMMGITIGLQFLVEGARFTDTSWPAYLPLLYAVFNISGFGRVIVHWVCLPAAAVYAMAVTLLLTLRRFGYEGWPVLYSLQSSREYQAGGEFEIVGTFAAVSVISVGLAVGAWCAGLAMRKVHQVYAARQHARALEAELAVVEEELLVLSERERLAQEVHDVMAHSLAVITAQADGTRMMHGTLPTAAAQALNTIADTAREGLTELRRLLDANPNLEELQRPRLTDLHTLLDRVRSAGHACEFAEFGEAKPLTPMQQLSVFRIVQEALTNAVRHSDSGGPTKITLDWRGPGLVLLIATPTNATATTGEPRPGRGIRGMQERAQIAGGWLTAGVDDDAFIVNAFVPVDAPADAPVDAPADKPVDEPDDAPVDEPEVVA